MHMGCDKDADQQYKTDTCDSFISQKKRGTFVLETQTCVRPISLRTRKSVEHRESVFVFALVHTRATAANPFTAPAHQE